MTLDKAVIARRQLGAALSLFLNDLDPVSVHCLACGGGEIAETLTNRSGKEAFSAHALEVVPDLKVGELRKIRNRYWNAFKHALDHSGKDRADAETITKFDDTKNDHVLFVGWYDLMLALGKMPIEAQAFQIWYFAKYPEKLDLSVDKDLYMNAFPEISSFSRSEQKKILCKSIEDRRGDREIMDHHLTDPRPLLMGVL